MAEEMRVTKKNSGTKLLSGWPGQVLQWRTWPPDRTESDFCQNLTASSWFESNGFCPRDVLLKCNNQPINQSTINQHSFTINIMVHSIMAREYGAVRRSSDQRVIASLRARLQTKILKT
jgi:hypothetical protein